MVKGYRLMVKGYRILSVILVLAAMVMVGCRKEVGGTNVRVKDPVRHYIPILQGDELQMLWWLYNDGPNPLIVTSIQPACSAISLVSERPSLVPVGDSALMVFVFQSDENINLATHKIRIFGNIIPKGVTEMQFSVSVVRPTPNHSDFEERLLKRLHEPQFFENNKTRRNDYTTDSILHHYYEY
ncbi:MAG: hypothetical protein J5761_05575 [Paludibacteraceae bacterium]|nr:hypothetical protein [Paludibacteraceae bacterium]